LLSVDDEFHFTAWGQFGLREQKQSDQQKDDGQKENYGE
jgi:hypothetical protein